MSLFICFHEHLRSHLHFWIEKSGDRRQNSELQPSCSSQAVKLGSPGSFAWLWHACIFSLLCFHEHLRSHLHFWIEKSGDRRQNSELRPSACRRLWSWRPQAALLGIWHVYFSSPLCFHQHLRSHLHFWNQKPGDRRQNSELRPSRVPQRSQFGALGVLSAIQYAYIFSPLCFHRYLRMHLHFCGFLQRLYTLCNLLSFPRKNSRPCAFNLLSRVSRADPGIRSFLRAAER